MNPLTDEELDAFLDGSLTDWTRDDLRAAIDLYQSGVTIRGTSEACNMAYDTLRRAFVTLKINIRKKGDAQRVFTDEQENFMLQCSRRGMSVTALAAYYRVSRETISKALARARKRKVECRK